MGLGKTLTILAALGSPACSDLPPYPYAMDAGSDAGYDARGALCSKNSPDPSASIPPSDWVRQAVAHFLNFCTYVRDPAHVQVIGDIDDARADLKSRLEANGFAVVGELYETGVDTGAACLDPDLVGVVLNRDPVIDGERKDTRKATLLLLKVKTPGGKEAKAGLHGQWSMIAGETDSKVAGVIAGVVVEEDGCSSFLPTALGAPASLAVYEKGGSSGLDVSTYYANVGHVQWETAPDGVTAIGPGQGFYGREDQCNAAAYLDETEHARDFLEPIATVKAP